MIAGNSIEIVIANFPEMVLGGGNSLITNILEI